MHNAIHTRESALAINNSDFKRLSQSEPGTQRRIVGRLIPDYAAGKSAIIVKRTTRQVTQGIKRQGRQGARSYYKYYTVLASDYCTAWICWATGDVEEIRAYASQVEATKAQRRMSAHFSE